VGLPEGQTLLDQVVGQVGGQHRLVQGRRHPLLVDGHRGDRPGDDGEGQGQRFHGVEEGLLVLLEVLVVAAGRPLEHREQRHQVAQEPSAFPSRQLQAVRVLLLGHQAGAGAVGIG